MTPPAAATTLDQDVPSPCTNVCKMSPATGYCEGCQRTIAEIAGWSEYTDGEKRAVIARLPTRKTRC
jgi:hypothetical protein